MPIKCRSIDGNGSSDILECTAGANPTDEKLAMVKTEVEDEQRLVDEEAGSAEQTLELEHDENTEWLRTSEWPRWFQSRPFHIIILHQRYPLFRISRSFWDHGLGRSLLAQLFKRWFYDS